MKIPSAIVVFLTGLLLVGITSGKSLCHAHANSESIPVIAEMEYRIYVDLNPKDVDLRNKYGMLLLNRNKINEAESQFTLILSMAPQNFDALDALGLIRIRQQRYQEAIKLLQDAIQINPKDIMVFFHLGNAFAATGQIKEARQAYETAITLKNQASPAATAILSRTEEEALVTALKNLKAQTTMTNPKTKGTIK